MVVYILPSDAKLLWDCFAIRIISTFIHI